MIGGKAQLVRDDYCDGLGNCLPACPTGAITFEEREAPEYNAEEVEKHKAKLKHETHGLHSGCPGMAVKTIRRTQEVHHVHTANASELRQWPCQIKLVNPAAPFFEDAHLLVAADCTAYARADFHERFMKDKITAIGCPKLDNTDYSDKLAEMLARNDIKSVTVVRMEVPCCGGLVNMVKAAMDKCGKMIPWQVVTLGTDGTLVGSVKII